MLDLVRRKLLGLTMKLSSLQDSIWVRKENMQFGTSRISTNPCSRETLVKAQVFHTSISIENTTSCLIQEEVIRISSIGSTIKRVSDWLPISTRCQTLRLRKLSAGCPNKLVTLTSMKSEELVVLLQTRRWKS